MPSPGPDLLSPSLPSLLAHAHALPSPWAAPLSRPHSFWLPTPLSLSPSAGPHTSPPPSSPSCSPALSDTAPPKNPPQDRDAIQDLCPGKERGPDRGQGRPLPRVAYDHSPPPPPLLGEPGLPSPLGRTSSEPWRAPSGSSWAQEASHSPVRLMPGVWKPPPRPPGPSSTFHRLQQELHACEEALRSPSPFLFRQGCQHLHRLLRRTLQHANEGTFFETLLVLFRRLDEEGENGLDLGPVRSVFEAALCERCATCWSPSHRQMITQRQGHMPIHEAPSSSSWEPPTLPEADEPEPALPPAQALPSLRAVLPPLSLWVSPAQPPAPRPPPSPSPFLRVEPPGRAGMSMGLSQPALRSSPSPTPNQQAISVGAPAARSRGTGEKREGRGAIRTPSSRTYPFWAWEGDYLIRPRSLGHAEKAFTIRLSFTLSPALYQATQGNEGLCAIHLLVIDHKSGKAGPSPAGLQYLVNGQALSTPGRGSATRYGFDMTALCHAGTNELSITAHQCCCNLEFAVRPVRSQMKALMQRVHARTIPREVCLHHLLASFAAHGELAPVRTTLTLCCPLSLSPLQTPVRGQECTHVQCFDLENYLLANRGTPTWRCPLCQKRARLDDLVVDGYLRHILQQVDDTVHRVHLDAQGGWSPVHSPSPSGGGDSEDSEGEEPPVSLSWTGKRRGASHSPPSPREEAHQHKKWARVGSTRPWVDLT